MGRRTAVIRVRFPYDVLEQLDRLAERLRTKVRRRVPRAALVRALVRIQMDAAEERSDLIEVLGADPVRRGRERSSSRASRRRAASSSCVPSTLKGE